MKKSIILSVVSVLVCVMANAQSVLTTNGIAGVTMGKLIILPQNY